MWPERFFAALLVFVGGLFALVAAPNVVEALRTPIPVTVEDLERGGAGDGYVALSGFEGPQAPPIATGELGRMTFPLRSPAARAAGAETPRVFVERFPKEASRLADPAAPPVGTVAGFARLERGYVLDSLRDRYPGLEEAVLVFEGRRPPALGGPSAGLLLGLLLAGAGLAIGVLSFRAGRSRVIGRIMEVFVEPLGVLGLGLGVMVAFLGAIGEGAAIPAFAASSVGCLASAFAVSRRARKHLAATAADLEAADPRPPVLYLRSFQADETTARVTESFGDKTEEELTAEVLSCVGPVVAIGRPGERLPEVGAARMYVEDARWQEVVAAYMDRSGLVVLRLGSTMGFWWELERSGKVLDPTRLLILSPYDRERYAEFRRLAETRFPKALPEYAESDDGRLARLQLGSLRAAILFGPDWRPEYVDLTRPTWPWSFTFATLGRQRLYRTLQWSLRALGSRAGAPWVPRPRWTSGRAATLAACVALAALAGRDGGTIDAVSFLPALSLLLLFAGLGRLALAR